MLTFISILTLTIVAVIVLIYLYVRKQTYINQANMTSYREPSLHQYEINAVDTQIAEVKQQKINEASRMELLLKENEQARDLTINSRISKLNDNVQHAIDQLG